MGNTSTKAFYIEPETGRKVEVEVISTNVRGWAYIRKAGGGLLRGKSLNGWTSYAGAQMVRTSEIMVETAPFS